MSLQKRIGSLLSKRIFITALVLTLFTTFALGVVSIGTEAKAQETVCTNETIRGSYGSLLSGFTVVPNSNTDYPYASVFSRNFDGNGNFTGIGVGSINNGNPTQGNISGTYAVNSDCTITQSLTIDLSNGKSVDFASFGVIVDGGRKIFIIRTTPGTIQTGTLERVSPRFFKS